MDPRITLIETNVHWLQQALRLLDRVDDNSYSTSPAGMSPHRPGGHLRHVIEFFQAFLDGLHSGVIDYDARRRDPEIERSRIAAAAAIRRVVRALETTQALRLEANVWVRLEDASARNVSDSLMHSSISRELQVLSSHTIHHFALMAMTLRLHGVEMDPAFGMAPSTLRYLASRTEVAA